MTTQSHTGTEQIVWICRHGNRIDFVDPSWRGRNGDDPHLSPDGVVQAQETGRRLKGEGIRYIFSSPFLRTVETAHYIAEEIEVPICIEQGASEWLNPEWFSTAPALMSPQDLAQRFPRVDPSYTSVIVPHFPETDAQALARERKAIRFLTERYPGPLLFVGHGHSVTGLAWGLLDTLDEVHTGLCGLVKLVHRNSHWTMELNGDTTHLTSGETQKRHFS